MVAGIALADSLNPSTIGPGLVFAMADRPARRILELAAGAFVVNAVAGVLLLLGPGHLLLALLPSPSHHTRHVGELVAGIALLLAAIAVWLVRQRLADRGLPGTGARGGTAFKTGATIMLVELPTAFPYFAAIAVIVGLDASLSVEVLLLCIFNLIFLAPLLAMSILLHSSSAVHASVIQPVARRLASRWPHLLAGVLAVLGVVLSVLGVVGLAGA